jgi:hypothetical protein
MASITQHWASIGSDWAYYFHSDTAVDRLLAQDWPEFPHISIAVACLEGKGTLKADLWRYLVLWEYGGVYADVDTKPNLFNASSIRDEDDGFFVVEQYHLLSQYFMVMSPRHRKFTIAISGLSIINRQHFIVITSQETFSTSHHVLLHPECPILPVTGWRYGNNKCTFRDWSPRPSPRLSGLSTGCGGGSARFWARTDACPSGCVDWYGQAKHYCCWCCGE